VDPFEKREENTRRRRHEREVKASGVGATRIFSCEKVRLKGLNSSEKATFLVLFFGPKKRTLLATGAPLAAEAISHVNTCCRAESNTKVTVNTCC